MIKWNPELYGRFLLSLTDFTDAEMLELVDLAVELKARRRAGIRGDLLSRRNIALIFEKSSTRTRTSASIAVRDEGGAAEYLSKSDIHLGVKESVKDTARVLGRTFDGILFRGFSQERVETLAKYAGVPVWNGLTDTFHPTQILADLMTIKENFGKLKGLKVAYVGDGRNNVANSLMIGCMKAGVNFVNCTPKELLPDSELVEKARVMGERNGATVEVFTDPHEGVKGANVIYTDVWVSMGEESEKESRLKLLQPYQINRNLVKATGTPDDEFIFLHCLPAFHDKETAMSAESGALEVTDDVFEAPFSKVFDEAENRMHTIKALYVSALADGAAL
ncbi:MAG: ornithine carbamoyltransferase [Kiritimatiellae bacterium]|jgi:ornithine carbamoyltransferase|nr:ornithine carbamoyltransferase [Kiritimatiellia bacterium]